MRRHKKRNSWPDFFMELAETYAKRSTCPRAHVGCVIVANKRVIGAGFNGAPSGVEHCESVSDCSESGHCLRSIHAEINAVIQACKLAPMLVDDSVAYVTHSPCYRCASILRQAGIRIVVYNKRYGSNVDYSLLTSDGQFSIQDIRSFCDVYGATPWEGK